LVSTPSLETGENVGGEFNLRLRSDVEIRDLVWERDSSSMASSVCVSVVDGMLWR
jgi:hypothetical protein